MSGVSSTHMSQTILDFSNNFEKFMNTRKTIRKKFNSPDGFSNIMPHHLEIPSSSQY